MGGEKRSLLQVMNGKKGESGNNNGREGFLRYINKSEQGF